MIYCVTNADKINGKDIKNNNNCSNNDKLMILNDHEINVK